MSTSFMVRYSVTIDFDSVDKFVEFMKRLKKYIVFIKRVREEWSNQIGAIEVLAKSEYEAMRLRITIRYRGVSYRYRFNELDKTQVISENFKFINVDAKCYEYEEVCYEDYNYISYTIEGNIAIVIDGREKFPLLDIVTDYGIIHQPLLRPM